jgi:hypothetical protein
VKESTMANVARLADGGPESGGVTMAPLPLTAGAGLVMRRRKLDGLSRRERATVMRARSRRMVFPARSEVAVGGAARLAGLEFVEVDRGELTRIAVSMARVSDVVSVTLHPAGCPTMRTAAAVAVADLLRAERGGNVAVVTCGLRPLVGLGRSAVPHAVTVEVDGSRLDLAVWEVVAWEDVPSWLAGLASGPVAA